MTWRRSGLDSAAFRRLEDEIERRLNGCSFLAPDGRP